ncbi:hypothetical protein [Stenotrophomonas maltophilia]|uniref:hypothetical protein n=1 Tax=Stenotrophomonas maltophilia TaxID=40324 RepID=UPI0007F8AC27|nr:hypothetical protein [Stenotrophomonas maltophilia]OBU55447.1 hypothetical protein A9K70_21035 [Stenotrophomonas maltophilia]
MNTNNKTLADVKPGGRVRLGDAPWPEIDAILADAYSAGAEGLPFEGIARRAAVRKAVATLSAQPSPGGQGGLNYERMFVDACAALAEVSRELGCDPEQGGAEPILAAIAELREALAARQPVGEPFGYCADFDPGAHEFSHTFYYLAPGETVPAGCTAFYAGPPAQAVDLGQFRAQVAELLRREFDLEVADPDDHRHDDGAGEADRIAGTIAALIDSQAVGK